MMTQDFQLHDVTSGNLLQR